MPSNERLLKLGRQDVLDVLLVRKELRKILNAALSSSDVYGEDMRKDLHRVCALHYQLDHTVFFSRPDIVNAGTLRRYAQPQAVKDAGGQERRWLPALVVLTWLGSNPGEDRTLQKDVLALCSRLKNEAGKAGGTKARKRRPWNWWTIFAGPCFS